MPRDRRADPGRAAGAAPAAGKVTPVIDRRYPFAEVPDALRYLESGRASGKVVVTMCGQGASE